MINIILVTTWDTACGIAEHSALLKEHVEAADREIQLFPDPTVLDPATLNLSARSNTHIDLLHLNYQAALHSRWQPETIGRVQQLGLKVVVTYHDTGVPNADQCKAIVDAADVTIVHEPCDDLPVEKIRYWRMGVPALQPSGLTKWDGREQWNLAYSSQPVLGSVGFPFPWKNYDELARITAACGWALYLIAPRATDEDLRRWTTLNLYTTVRRDFVNRRAVVRLLNECDATAFCYTCANTGQSAAILQGIAARKPVIALATCRQFRALYEEYPSSLRWVSSFDSGVESLEFALKTTPIARVDTRTVYVAEQESWTKLGAKYARLYRDLVNA